MISGWKLVHSRPNFNQTQSLGNWLDLYIFDEKLYFDINKEFMFCNDNYFGIDSVIVVEDITSAVCIFVSTK